MKTRQINLPTTLESMNFEELTKGVKNKLYRFALRITGDNAEAEDVVQEVFIKTWQRLEELPNIQNAEAWCMTLTKNLSLDKLRSKHRRTEEIGEVLQLTDYNSTPYETLAGNDMISRIRDWMKELPEKQRLVMHLRDIEDKTYEEISIILDMPMPQVKVNLHRARTAIRERILETEVNN
jgi:RNA polymerase sigma factor (sigma-70 family)